MPLVVERPRRLNLMPQTALLREKQPFHQALLEYYDYPRLLVQHRQRIPLQEQKAVNLNQYELLYHAYTSQHHLDVSILRYFHHLNTILQQIIHFPVQILKPQS